MCGQRSLRAEYLLRCAVLALALTPSSPARAADPTRGALLFASPPAQGLLGCADCHSENPVVNNFGNIWAGRNAPALIERAIQSNTGGMGYLRNHRSADDIADIAAYLGNSPTSVAFPLTPIGERSSVRTVTVATSTKAGAGAFSARVEGEFEIVASDCSTERPRFSNCSIDLVFSPSGTGERRGALVMNHDATPTPVRLALSGLAPERPPAVARVSPQAIDFGSSPVGLTTAPRNATLANDSAEPLTVTGLDAEGGFAVVGGSCAAGTVLGHGQRCTAALRFEAQTVGLSGGRLRLRHDGAGGSSEVALTGRGETLARGRLQADVEGLDFGGTGLDSGPSRTQVRLHNIGTGDWTTLYLGPPGSGFGADATACSAALPLEPGQSCLLPVSFAPPRSGRFSATLRIGGAGLDAPLELPLQGRGLNIDVPQLRADAGRLLFDAVLGRSDWQQITVSHSGTQALPLAAPRFDGPHAADYAIDAASSTCGSVLPAGAACRIELRFTPGATGPRSARLQMAATAALSPLFVDLAGRATAAPAPRLSLDAAALRFAGNQPSTASSAPQRLTVRNKGSVDGHWARLHTVGEHAAEFLLTGSCVDTRSLPAGGTCQIDVAFAPTAPGARMATLLLQPEGAEPSLVSLSGSAATPAAAPLAPMHASTTAALVVLPEHVVFQAGPATAGQPQTQATRWRNDGTAVLHISAFDLQGAGFSMSVRADSLDRCPDPPFDLLPGEACSVRLTWSGSSAGAGGGRLSARADDPWGGVSVDVAVGEDPGQRSHVGTGGGAPGSIGWWLGLLLAAVVMASARDPAKQRRTLAGSAGL